MSNRKLTQLDVNQIHTRLYDEDKEATRVVVVAGDLPKFEVGASDFFPKTTIERIEVPVIVKEIQLKEIEKVIVVPETRVEVVRVEVPVTHIITETKVVEVQVPQIIVEKQIVEVEKIKEIKLSSTDIQFPQWLKICLILQTIASFGILITRFLK